MQVDEVEDEEVYRHHHYHHQYGSQQFARSEYEECVKQRYFEQIVERVARRESRCVFLLRLLPEREKRGHAVVAYQSDEIAGGV